MSVPKAVFEVTDESVEVQETISKVADKVEGNETIVIGEISDLVKALTRRHVSYFGEVMSFEKYLTIARIYPDGSISDYNATICRLLEEGEVLHGEMMMKLRYLPIRTAKILKKTHDSLKKRLCIELKEISLEIAREFGDHKYGLDFAGLTEISVEFAREFAKGNGGLSLNGLQKLNVDVARELAAYQGEFMTFNSIDTISEEVCEELSKFSGEIWLPCLKKNLPEDQLLLLLARNPNFEGGLGLLRQNQVKELRRKISKTY